MPPRQRRLSGEIHVPPTLTPGIQTPLFEVYVRVPSFLAWSWFSKPLQHTVALFAPAAPGLVLTDESARQSKNARMPLHAMRVGVASLHPDGVRPLPITPPSYVQPEPWPTSDTRSARIIFLNFVHRCYAWPWAAPLRDRPPRVKPAHACRARADRVLGHESRLRKTGSPNCSLERVYYVLWLTKIGVRAWLTTRIEFVSHQPRSHTQEQVQRGEGVPAVSWVAA
jgi:hypothetical protein